MSYNNNYKPSEMADAIRGISKIPINISDILTSEDEDKVVQNGELVVQTSHTEVTENGTYDVTTNNSITVNVEASGGNPNYVETIQGTLKNPWGNITASDLAAAFASNEVSVFLQITVNSKTVIVNPIKNGNYLLFSVAVYDPDDAESPGWSNIASATYLTSTGKLVYAYYQQYGTLVDLEQMADNVTTVLTIIHHPLPDTP